MATPTELPSYWIQETPNFKEIFSAFNILKNPSLYFPKYFLFLLLLLLLIAPFSATAEIKLKTEFSSNSMILGDEVTLQLKIDGTKENVNLIFPSIDGISFHQLSSPTRSSQTTIINGQITSFSGLVYRIAIRSSKIGNYKIPGITVRHNNKSYRSTPFQLRITKATTNNTMKLFMEINKHRVYVQEPIQITLTWLVRENIEEYTFHFPLLEQKDELSLRLLNQSSSGSETTLTLGNYKVPFIQSETEKDGSYYTKYAATFEIIPTKAGLFEIPAPTVKAKVQRGSRVQQDFFGRRINVPKLESVFVNGKPQQITIKELPTKNRPSNFSGSVGDYSILITAKEKQVKVGDPIELTIEIKGEGKLSEIQVPLLSEMMGFSDNFTFVDTLQPGDIQENRVVFKQIIRPKNEDITQIPSVLFSFFNPGINEYTQIKSNTLPLKVLPTRLLTKADVIVHDEKPSTRSKDLTITTKGLGANYIFKDALESQTTNWRWNLLLLFFPISYFIIRFSQGKRQTLHSDKTLLRSKSAKSLTNKRLKEVQNLINIEGTEFFQKAALALTGFIADKLNLGSSELTSWDLKNLAAENKIPTEITRDMISLLNNFDQNRFAVQSVTSQEKQSSFEEIKRLINLIEKRI